MASATSSKRAPWSLRRRLTWTVAGLLVGTSILVGIVSVLSLRSFLVERLDAQLSNAVLRSQAGFDGHNDHDTDNKGPRPQGALLAPGQAAGTLVIVRSTTGTVTAGILGNGGVNIVSTTQVGQVTAPRLDQPFTLNTPGLGEFRALAVQAATGETFVVALPTTEVNAATTQLLIVIILVTGVGLAVTIVAGRYLIRYELKPLERVAETAQAVATLPLDRGEVSLAERVSEADTDPRTEVGRVGLAVNTMLDHIDEALTARQASEEKVRQFVADASHELRTPLASIRGYSELTRRSGEELSEPMTHALSRIESEAIRMTDLVEDLLLLARLDEGRELVHGEVDLTRVVVDCVGDANVAGPDHTWKLHLPDAPVAISGDQARLHQVIANLLANARIHTPAGTSVDVTLDQTDAQAIVKVRDNGPGIPAAQRKTLFERFTRGDSSRTRATGSTGLGLAIVQAVVESHGGKVSVASRKGRTEFTVTLPKAPPAQQGDETA
jgi:two-component system OmpR family sensor kinase